MFSKNILLTFIVVLISHSTLLAFNENNYSNSDKLNACDILEKANNLYNDDQSDKTLLKIERMLFEAMSLIPESVDRLNFIRIESRIHNAGRWAQYHDVEVPRYCEYQPQKLMGKIRMHIPPEPWAKANLIANESGLTLMIQIQNMGKSYMENIDVMVTTPNALKPTVKQIKQIKPGEKETLQFSTPKKNINKNFTISFKEQYGFAPCDLQF